MRSVSKVNLDAVLGPELIAELEPVARRFRERVMDPCEAEGPNDRVQPPPRLWTMPELDSELDRLSNEQMAVVDGINTRNTNLKKRLLS